MSVKNLCAILHGPNDLRLEERPIPIATRDKVQITMRSVGLCGSDSALYRTGRVGLSSVKEPVVLGHEPCGVISAVGSDVTDLVVGDRVAILSYTGCGDCNLCQMAHFNLCPLKRLMSIYPTDGALANYIVWPARLCYKIPDDMTWDQAAFVQPVAMALYGCEKAAVKPGHRVLICGAGPLGMSMVMAAKASGASRICVTDNNENRLQFLAKVSGCMVVNAKQGTPRDVADRVMSRLGQEADVSLECCGAPSAVSTAIYATKLCGRILLVGYGPAEVEIPLLQAFVKELVITSTVHFINTYPAAIEMLASGQIDVTPYITHKFPLGEVQKGFDKMAEKVQGKIIIQCSEDETAHP